MTDTPTLVLVHGAWHGPWAWTRLQRLLADVDTHAVDLPSSGSDPTRLGSLDDDAELLNRAVNAIDGPVVVCAHSYGGVVATHALTDARNVERLVYLAALPLDEGESIRRIAGQQVPEWWDLHRQTGYVDVAAPEIFYTDCTRTQARDATARLVHQSWRSFTDPVATPAWRTIPSTYVICTRDQALHPVAQGVLSARCTDVRLLPASHSPFLSQPDALADVLRHELWSTHA
jgi:pimeloyl-ACP methyl ester carboxylesterase